MGDSEDDYSADSGEDSDYNGVSFIINLLYFFILYCLFAWRHNKLLCIQDGNSFEDDKYISDSEASEDEKKRKRSAKGI